MGSANSDRQLELQKLDETKAGVKGLVDTGISKVPPMFVHPFITSPSSNLPSKSSDTNNPLTFPIIDLDGLDIDSTQTNNIIEKIRDASQNWGFFLVVNHGIPVNVMDEMYDGIKSFFEQDIEVKKGYYSRDFGNKKVNYYTNYDLYTGLAPNWRDTLNFVLAPTPVNPEELPAICRETTIEYTKEMMKLGMKMVRLMSLALGLERNHLEGLGWGQGLSIAGHYFPPCPQPELVLGCANHTDNSFLTILLRDHVPGLQFIIQNQWYDIPHIPGSFLVNIGDHMQVLSNDKFKSTEHRVVTNKDEPRVSIASAFSNYEQSIGLGPIKELISEDDPPKYRQTTTQEFVTHFQTKGNDGIPALQHFRI